MTVGQLVQVLQSYPQDMRVVVNGYEEGYDDLSPEQIFSVKIALNTGNHPWEGQHGDPRHPADRRVNTAHDLPFMSEAGNWERFAPNETGDPRDL